MTGKYAGRCRRFPVVPVVVFANFHPDYSALSKDRWQVLTLGNEPLSNLSVETKVSSSHDYSFVSPISLPDLSEDFDLREYIEKNVTKQSKTADVPTGEYQMIVLYIIENIII